MEENINVWQNLEHIILTVVRNEWIPVVLECKVQQYHQHHHQASPAQGQLFVRLLGTAQQCMCRLPL